MRSDVRHGSVSTVLLALLLASCPDSRPRPGGTPRPPGSGNDAGAAQDGGTTDGGPGRDGGVGGSAAGVVSVRQRQNETSITGIFVTGSFTNLEAFILPGCGELAVAGDCAAYDCSNAMVETLEAGDLTVAVAGGEPTVIAPSSGIYLQVAQTRTFNPNDDVVIAASGAAFPQFEAMLTAPSPPVTSLPAGAIDTNVPLTISWTPDGIANDVLLSISDPVVGLIACRADANTGTITVPAAVLSQLSGSATLTLVNRTQQTTAVQGRPLHLSVGESVQSDVDLQ